MMLGKAFTLAIALTTSGALPPPAAHDPVDFASAEAEARAQARRTEIAAELTGAADHEWAGSYYRGDGLGANVALDLAPGAGFVFEWHGCMGLYGRNYGSVSESGGHVLLEPELANEPGQFAGIDLEFLPVSWGARHYLVVAGEVQSFCNAVNGGSEPRGGPHGIFLLRRGDETTPATGRPRTRDGGLDCVLERPIQATIASVGRRHTKKGGDEATIPVVLDAGREQGVWQGMELHPLAPNETYETARVTRVFERSSEAVFQPFAHDDFQPRPGWRLSTRRD